MEVWFSDLTLDGKQIPLARDPEWEINGSRLEFTERIVRPFNDAKWRTTALAGGESGELGGVFWRDDPPAFLATPIGGLTLDEELYAAGRIVMTGAAADSGVYLGWFNAASKTNRSGRDRQVTQTNALAVAIEGPSRTGHFFRAACWDAIGKGVLQGQGPILAPDGKPRNWSLQYTPKNSAGHSQITITLDDQKSSIELPDEVRRHGAVFTHFGFFNFQPDGHYLNVLIDDLEYSTRMH